MRNIPENPWEFFRDIYVINLKHRNDRLKTIDSELSKLSCKYNTFNAIYGKNIPMLKDYCINHNIIEPSWTYSNAQLGCLMSHRTIWENNFLSYNENPEWILILEDDCVFDTKLTTTILREYLRNLPDDALHFKFGYATTSNPSVDHYYKSDNKYWTKTDTYTNGLYCYAINTSLLKALCYYKFKYPIDILIISATYVAIHWQEYDHPDTGHVHIHKESNNNNRVIFRGFVWPSGSTSDIEI